MKAEIITIGDEILIGQIVDTNSAWIADQFNLNGIEICQITSVHDEHNHIVEALRNAAKKVACFSIFLPPYNSKTGYTLHYISTCSSVKQKFVLWLFFHPLRKMPLPP